MVFFFGRLFVRLSVLGIPVPLFLFMFAGGEAGPKTRRSAVKANSLLRQREFPDQGLRTTGHCIKPGRQWLTLITEEVQWSGMYGWMDGRPWLLNLFIFRLSTPSRWLCLFICLSSMPVYIALPIEFVSIYLLPAQPGKLCLRGHVFMAGLKKTEGGTGSDSSIRRRNRLNAKTHSFDRNKGTAAAVLARMPGGQEEKINCDWRQRSAIVWPRFLRHWDSNSFRSFRISEDAWFLTLSQN